MHARAIARYLGISVLSKVSAALGQYSLGSFNRLGRFGGAEPIDSPGIRARATTIICVPRPTEILKIGEKERVRPPTCITKS